MNQSSSMTANPDVSPTETLLTETSLTGTLSGDAHTRVELALSALREGRGVLLVDDADRENEGDMIFAAESITPEQMALMIRHGSGIVCLCLNEAKIAQLQLPMMVSDNKSRYGTGFTVSIEAREGVTTGVSAADRVTTVKAAIADHAQPSDLASPGHMFPLRAREGGVLTRRGHTEGTIDLMRLAGLKSAGVLCEVTLDDGTMARLPEILDFGQRHHMPVLSIEDLVAYILNASDMTTMTDQPALASPTELA